MIQHEGNAVVRDRVPSIGFDALAKESPAGGGQHVDGALGVFSRPRGDPASDRIKACAHDAGKTLGQSRQKSLNRVGDKAVYRAVCVIEAWPSQS